MTDSDLTWDVSFYLRGADLDPEQITKLLGFPPTRSRRRGRVEISSSGREVHPKLGVWVWAVQSDDRDLNVHMAALIDRFGGTGILRDLPNVADAFIDVHLTWTQQADIDFRACWSLSPSLLKQLADLQLPVNWTFDGVTP